MMPIESGLAMGPWGILGGLTSSIVPSYAQSRDIHQGMTFSRFLTTPPLFLSVRCSASAVPCTVAHHAVCAQLLFSSDRDVE